jgi:deoxyribonuclease-4
LRNIKIPIRSILIDRSVRLTRPWSTPPLKRVKSFIARSDSNLDQAWNLPVKQTRARLLIGVHVSIAESISSAVDRAVERGCGTFQIFTRNPRGWKHKELDEKDAAMFIKKLAEARIGPVVSHMPYLPNLASPREDIYRNSVADLIDEVRRCTALRIPYLVTHLGSHLGEGEAVGFQRIINALQKALDSMKSNVVITLENTAGTKNSMGGTFEMIRDILEEIGDKRRLAVCFDTCHAFAAGYDVRTEEALMKTMDHFDEVIGLNRLRVVHLNDSKGGLNSRLDRHEHIGMGMIGEGGFEVVIPFFASMSLPQILETPIDERRDDFGNLRKLREIYERSRP